MLHHAHLL